MLSLVHLGETQLTLVKTPSMEFFVAKPSRNFFAAARVGAVAPA
jgi:hypothetical protein